MKKVLIPTKLDPEAARLLTKTGRYEVVMDASRKLEDLVREHPDAYAMIVRSERITSAIMDALPRLKVIIRAGSGVDTIDTRYARSRGIDVMNTPGANANAVAEEVIGLMLADARQIPAADASVRGGKWEKGRFMGREIAGKTVGIVGLGSIGRLVAKRLSGFECRLLGYDPAISPERARDMNVELTDIETLFAASDYITLHIPENRETRRMIGAGLLSRMKEGATLINCARAGILDEQALREIKPRKKLRFLNDVYLEDREGPKSVADIADLMMPHLGASTVEANLRAARQAAQELIDFDEKGITAFIVNRDIPEGLDRAYCDLAFTLARLCRCLVGRQAVLKGLQTSFYGGLEPFADWLLVSLVAGLAEDFDRSSDATAARAYLEDKGIEYVNRRTDPAKGYGNSITVDLIGQIDTGNLRQMSIRGTVAEGVLMVSRINEFTKLYFEPVGDIAFFLYDDRPGVIGTIGSKLARAGINIEDMRNPHDLKTNRSLAILKINRPLSDDLLADIQREIAALSAFSIHL